MFIEESCESCWPGDGRAWEVDGRAQALVGPGLATPLMKDKRKDHGALDKRSSDQRFCKSDAITVIV